MGQLGRWVTTVILILAIAESVSADTIDAQKAVLVTVASSGIGLKITGHLSANGYYIYAGARKAADLERLNAMDNVSSVRLSTLPGGSSSSAT